ncbi:MAG: hypothetical protein AAFQ63_18635 [Cyanobacteria bacterium J06621_11]
MNDKEIAEQLKKTGNLMDLLSDPDWQKRNAEEASSCSGYVEAGVGLQSYVDQLKKVSPEAFRAQKQQVKLLSILLPALHNWLNLWELGLSFESVYAEAQRLVYEQLTQAIEMQAEWVDLLLTADNPTASVEVREILSGLFSEESWQILAKVAAKDMEERVLHRAQVHSQMPIAVNATA